MKLFKNRSEILKPTFKNFLYLIIVSYILSIVVYNGIYLKQKDLGLVNTYQYCNNGITKVSLKDSPIEILDFYYSSEGEKIASCDKLLSPPKGSVCAETVAVAGVCKEKGITIPIPFLLAEILVFPFRLGYGYFME